MAELDMAERTNQSPPLQGRESKTAGECVEPASTNTCRELVPVYSSDRPPQLSWEADKAWYITRFTGSVYSTEL